MLIRKRFAAGERGGVTAPLFTYLAPFQKGQGPVPGSFSRRAGLQISLGGSSPGMIPYRIRIRANVAHIATRFLFRGSEHSRFTRSTLAVTRCAK